MKTWKFIAQQIAHLIFIVVLVFHLLGKMTTEEAILNLAIATFIYLINKE